LKILNFVKKQKDKLVIGFLVKCLIILCIPLVYQHFAKTYPTDLPPAPAPAPVEEENAFVPTFANLSEIQTMDDILAHLFYVDSTAFAMAEDFPIEKLASLDLSLNLVSSVPRVLITHTHSQEFFIDSEEGNMSQSIVAVGRYLADILVGLGISVVHDTGIYDMVDGELKREGSYERMEQGVLRILEEHPHIELIIDLHRDAAPDGVHLITEIDGRPTAKIMFFNGITRRNIEGEPKDLDEFFNPYIQENLALSLQLFLTANEMYPNLARRNYVKAYRYSLHLKPRSILVEVGANTNTLEEAKNAMYPLSRLITQVVGVGEAQ